ERVVAGVTDGIGKPAAVETRFGVEDFFRRLHPVDLARGFRPEALRVALPARIDVVIAARAGVHRSSVNLRPHPEEARERRLEGWRGEARVSPVPSSFETHCFAMLLRMRDRSWPRLCLARYAQ